LEGLTVSLRLVSRLPSAAKAWPVLVSPGSTRSTTLVAK